MEFLESAHHFRPFNLLSQTFLDNIVKHLDYGETDPRLIILKVLVINLCECKYLADPNDQYRKKINELYYLLHACGIKRNMINLVIGIYSGFSEVALDAIY